MKKTIMALCMLAWTVCAEENAPEAVKVKVTGNRVSLRAAPNIEAVLMDRAMAGDELILRDNSNPEWVGVLPPETVDLWVSSEFLDGNSVLPERLNIRSGPSPGHSVVGSAVRGERLTVREEIAGWSRILPTSDTTIWISRRYVEAPPAAMAEPESAPVVVQAEPADPVAAIPVPEPVQEPVLAETPVPVAEPAEPVIQVAEDAQKKLTMDLSGPQGIEAAYSGVLQPASGALYKLVDSHFQDVTVCYVRGNSAQMQTFTGMKLEVIGKTYLVQDMDYPVIVPARIRLFPASR